MKQTIKLRESELKRMISESVRRILREMDNDYEGNDLDYDSIQMQAMSVIPRMHQNGQDVSWRSVAEEMGFRLETLNGEDMELLKDAIEDTMMEDENPYYREDADFENDFKNLPYTNESINRIVNESVKRAINEIGDTKRGQYMLGRTLRRASDRDDWNTKHDIWDRMRDDANDISLKGYEEQGKLDNVKDDYFKRNQQRRNMQTDYRVYKMEDMDNLGRKFIDFIEHYDGGVLMQTIVDYESGNQTGKKESPLKEIIPYFEEEVLGYDCTPEMIDAIRKAYNQWWFYAEDQLMSYD